MKIALPSQLRLVTDKALLSSLESDLAKVEERLIEATAHAEVMVDSMTSHLAKAGGKKDASSIDASNLAPGNPWR